MEIGTRNNSDALSSEEAPTPSDSAESSTLSDDSEVSHHFQKDRAAFVLPKELVILILLLLN
jgi:hypothetical protein